MTMYVEEIPCVYIGDDEETAEVFIDDDEDLDDEDLDWDDEEDWDEDET
jgi:hypothetical protein